MDFNGAIDVDTAPGKGTRISIDIPADNPVAVRKPS